MREQTVHRTLLEESAGGSAPTVRVVKTGVFDPETETVDWNGVHVTLTVTTTDGEVVTVRLTHPRVLMGSMARACAVLDGEITRAI